MNDEVEGKWLVIMAMMGILLALIIATILIGDMSIVSAEATSEVSDGIDWGQAFMTYGPALVQIALILALCFNVWQRNVWRSVVCGGACVVTFILGW
jgi:hypothetical protein